MIPLSRLFQAPRDPAQVVAWGEGGALTWGDFRARVGGIARHFAGTPQVVLRCRDGWNFVTGLFGLWSAGAEVWLEGDGPVLDDDFQAQAAAWEHGPAPDAALVFLTSGSTGAAKPVRRLLGQLDAELAALQAQWGDTLADAPVLASVPHHHAYGLAFTLLWPLAAGRPFFARRHDLWEDILAALPPGGVLVTGPAHLTRLGGLAALPPGRRPRLVLSAGAPLPEAAAEEARALLGVPVTEIYGSTETGAVAHRLRDGGDSPFTALPGHRVERNEEGVLVLNGSATADRIELAGAGAFRLLGRADRVVKVEGKRVSLDQLERDLAALPEVERAAALVLDEGRAVLAAAVVPSAQGKALLAELGAYRFGRHLRGRLTEGPRRWRFVENLPVNEMGKCRAADLAALFAPPRLPPVLASRPWKTGIELDLAVQADLLWFQGHFPGVPILPGVAQIHWVLDFARSHLGVEVPAARDFQVKFKSVIRPGELLSLGLALEPAKGRLEFQLRRGEEMCAIGKVVLS